MIVVFSVLMFDRIRVDDPVGAISVHGVCGIWGTLAVGLFGGGAANLGVQAVGTFAYAAAAFVAGFVIFYLLKVTIGIRVSPQEEISGLDLAEHGTEAYAGKDTVGDSVVVTAAAGD